MKKAPEDSTFVTNPCLWYRELICFLAATKSDVIRARRSASMCRLASASPGAFGFGEVPGVGTVTLTGVVTSDDRFTGPLMATLGPESTAEKEREGWAGMVVGGGSIGLGTLGIELGLGELEVLIVLDELSELEELDEDEEG